MSFLRAMRSSHDALAGVLVIVILGFTGLMMLLPLSGDARRVAAHRFHLSSWSFPTWVVFQPVPSMFNFENRWEVTFDQRAGRPASCPSAVEGFINHHVFNRLIVPSSRFLFYHCGTTFTVSLLTTYRGTSVKTVYLVTNQNGDSSLTITRLPAR